MTTIHTLADNGEEPAPATAREALLVADEIGASHRFWLQFARAGVAATVAREYERGHQDGYAQAIGEVKALEHELVADARLELRRWHLCCPRCRTAGHRDGCPDCENRSQKTFADAMAAEPPAAGILALARASWEPLGLGPAGQVHLGGAAVHSHRPCTRACYAYRPGWYQIADAIRIIKTLPGNHDEILAELQARAAVPGSEAA